MGDPKKIMWVDDSPIITRVGEKTVTGLGHSLIVASSGEDALEKLKAGPVDLIITDITMPGMGGMELIRRIKGNAAYAATVILVASAESDQNMLKEAKTLGVKGWLVKPIDENILSAAIKKALGSP